MATYIAHGDVALSVLMTTASTVGAIVMTPLLVKVLAGAMVPVDAKVHCSCSHKADAEMQLTDIVLHVNAPKQGFLCSSACTGASSVHTHQPHEGRVGPSGPVGST